ncbi:MAG: hypothetical protein R3D98_05320 [Candidatus Krumholzibacteriia bacterium]
MSATGVTTIRALAAMALVLGLGCAGRDQTTAREGDRPAAGQTAGTPAAGADAAGFPMPAAPAGEDHVVGPIRHTAAGADQHGTCAVAVRREPERLLVDVTALPVNCCTETLRAAVAVADQAVTVRLYQYLPDVCECTHRRDVAFALAGIGEASSLAVFLDNGTEPVATASF